MRRLAVKLAEKWQQPFSQVSGMLHAKMSIAIIRATHLTIRGSRVSPYQTSKRIQWTDGAGACMFVSDN